MNGLNYRAVFAIFLTSILFFGTSACGQKTSKDLGKYEKSLSSVSPQSSEDSLFYALGFNIGSDLEGFFKSNGIEGFNMDLYIKGLLDQQLKKEDAVFADASASRAFFGTFIKKQKQKQGKIELEKGMKFFEEIKNKEGVKELPNGEGIQYKILKSGTGGVKPNLEDEVECHYVGTLIDGTEFDNSIKRGQPAKFLLNGVIKGWQLALAQMQEGDKWKLFIPSSLAYGERGAGGSIPPNATLIFDVELIKVHKKKK